MKLKQSAALVAAAALFGVQQPVLADSHGDGPGITMVHARTCSLNDRQDMDDLQRVINSWNAWADDQGVTDYFALTMTPNFHGPDTFDVGWIGTSQSGESLGAALDMWGAEGGDLAERFAEVVSCDSHSMFASVQAKPGMNQVPPDNVVVTFSDCKRTKGTSNGQFWDSMSAWADYMTEKGYPQAVWVWYPVFGAGGAEFDFKIVEGYPDHAAVGKSFDLWIEGEDWRHFERLMEPRVKCDDARVYDGKVQRRPVRD